MLEHIFDVLKFRQGHFTSISSARVNKLNNAKA